MPTIKFTAGKLTKEHKQELITKFTEISSQVTGTPMQFQTVLINELEDDAMGVGGKTVEEIKQGMSKK